MFARASDTRSLAAPVVARTTSRLKYKFIEYRILSRVLGLSEDPVLKAGMDSIPITAKDSKWKGDMKVRKALEDDECELPGALVDAFSTVWFLDLAAAGELEAYQEVGEDDDE